MSKAILKKNLMEKLGLTAKQAEESITCILDTITNETLENGKFQITGWGTFKLKQKEAHERFVPITGKVVKIPPKKYLTFKASPTNRFL